MTPTVRDGSVTLDITLIHPPEAVAQTQQQQRTDHAGAFLSWWKREVETRGLTHRGITGADRRIASNLLNTHGSERLRVLATHYFRRHAGTRVVVPIEMVGFASRIPVIETELKEQSP